MPHTQSRHRLTRAPLLLKGEQLEEMNKLADLHNRSLAGEMRQAVDYYLTANRRREAQQTARAAPSG